MIPVPLHKNICKIFFLLIFNCLAVWMRQIKVLLAKVIEKVLLQWLISTLSRELFYFVGINFFRIRTITWHVRLFSFDIAVRFVITITRKTWSTIIDKKGNQLFSICFLNFWNYMDYFRIRNGNLEIEKKTCGIYENESP